MTAPRSFDPIWEDKYATGHAQRYPWDTVVSFVLRNAPRDRPRANVRILEVGCGTGGNLGFVAAEGFRAAGIDASESAIATAGRQLADRGLQADLKVADFVDLPFETSSFDMVIDRGALTCCARSVIDIAISEVARVTKPGGMFLFTPYGDSDSSVAAGQVMDDGTVSEVTGGALAGVGQITFLSRLDIVRMLADQWRILSKVRREDCEMHDNQYWVRAEWIVTAQRT
jgi:ubiquinone/menaquinone biosynthesis C-methylase UbiE